MSLAMFAAPFDTSTGDINGGGGGNATFMQRKRLQHQQESFNTRKTQRLSSHGADREGMTSGNGAAARSGAGGSGAGGSGGGGGAGSNRAHRGTRREPMSSLATSSSHPSMSAGAAASHESRTGNTARVHSVLESLHLHMGGGDDDVDEDDDSPFALVGDDHDKGGSRATATAINPHHTPFLPPLVSGGDFLPPPISAGVQRTKPLPGVAVAVGHGESNNGSNMDRPLLQEGFAQVPRAHNDGAKEFMTLHDMQSNYPSDAARDAYYQKMVPQYASDRRPTGGGSSDPLMQKLNYIITLMEEQRDQATNHVTEEVILYSFLGIFVIFMADSFVRVGKYVR